MSSRKAPLALIVLGSVLAFGPLWGALATVIGMSRAFANLGASGPARPEPLAADVGMALWATMAGMVASPIGLVLLAGGIVWLVRITPCATQPEPAPQPRGTDVG